MLSCSPSYNIAEAYFNLSRRWDVPNLETLPMYTLSCYIAEIFPVLDQCWTYTLSYYIAELFLIL